MPAPIVAAVGKKVAEEGVRRLNKRFPGGIPGIIATVVLLLVGLVMASLSAFMAAFSGSAANAATAAMAGMCGAGGNTTNVPSAIPSIPATALDAYVKAGAASGVDWTYIAGIGKEESSHGTFGGRTIAPDGQIQPPIIGPALNGNGFAAIRDTDGGVWDGDTVWDRAVGPMQFIPGTWKSVGKDGNGDGAADPNNIYDAAMGTAFYLKSSGAPGDLHAAIWHYNHSERYIAAVLANAAEFQAQAAALPPAAVTAGPSAGDPVGDDGANAADDATPADGATGGGVDPAQGAAGVGAQGCGDLASGDVAAVLAQAQRWLGLPYSWGGGTLEGPSTGFAQGAGIVGFDCSSYVRYAYFHGAGVTLPRTSGEQYTATSAHTVLSGAFDVSALQPGDLLFYGGSAAGIHHVAMYAGNGQMLEEPHTGAVARLTAARGGSDFFAATRVLAGASPGAATAAPTAAAA